jgi:hypothetical protein
LKMLAEERGVEISDDEVGEILGDMKEMPPHPEVDPVGKHCTADVAADRRPVLGVCDDGAPHAAHAGEFVRCLSGAGAKAVLVARCGGDRRRGADCDLLILQPDNALAAGHRGLARSGGPGSPVAMAVFGLRSSRSHSGGVAGSPEGAVVASR